ncbi:hypothetical protein [Nocardia sp. NPDC060259]|uniref:hypothetical protein n=1 Tax=Nocardia sp. NPDC060259 TaxID=3347088 RepID=UPI00365FCCA9
MTDTPTPEFPADYEVSTETARIDAARVHTWLSTDAYWALGRPREHRDRAITGSLHFGVYERVSGQQVAYARVVTDRATFAWLCDVYVDRSARANGLDTALITTIRTQLTPTASTASCSPPETPTVSTKSSASNLSTTRRSGCSSTRGKPTTRSDARPSHLRA